MAEPVTENIQAQLAKAIAAASHGASIGAINLLTIIAKPVRKAAGGFNWDPVDLGRLAAERAGDFAEKQAGDLITGINETTRDTLGQLVSDAIASDSDVDELADRIEESGLFSDYRAEMIARTEINRAQNFGTLAAGREAEFAGMDRLAKVWTLGPDPCPLCEEAAEEGTIDLDDEFGDAGDAPPLHPNCQCELELVVLDQEEEEE